MSRKRHHRTEFPALGAKRSSGPIDENHTDAELFERQLDAEMLSWLSSPGVSWRYDSAWRDVRDALDSELNVPFNLHQFGSSATGLAFLDSDIDLCLEVLRPSRRPLLTAVQSALRSRRHLFSCVVAIRGARVPIVKFLHRPSNISGDISFSGTLAVRNTELIRLLCSMDSRVRPMLAFTKRWGRVQGVANGEGGANRLSSYTIALLTVFYLQTRLVLPPVADLLNVPRAKVYVLGWQCNIAPTQWVSSSSANLHELVVDFFVFYASFPFREQVVCPLLGRAVPRTDFLHASKLPPEMAAYADRVVPLLEPTTVEKPEDGAGVATRIDRNDDKTPEGTTKDQIKETNQILVKKMKLPRAMKPLPVGLAMRNKDLCVQDPFALDHNVARGQTEKEFARLTQALGHAVKVCKQTGASSLLPMLLTALPTATMLGRGTIRRAEGDVPADQWVATAMNAVNRILETVLLADVEPLPTTQVDSTSFACDFHHDLLQGRQAALAACRTSCASPVQEQASASAWLLANAASAARREPALACISVVLRPAQGPAQGPALGIEFKGREPKLKAEVHFAKMLMTSLQRWLAAELKFVPPGAKQGDNPTEKSEMGRDPQTALIAALNRE